MNIEQSVLFKTNSGKVHMGLPNSYGIVEALCGLIRYQPGLDELVNHFEEGSGSPCRNCQNSRELKDYVYKIKEEQAMSTKTFAVPVMLIFNATDEDDLESILDGFQRNLASVKNLLGDEDDTIPDVLFDELVDPVVVGDLETIHSVLDIAREQLAKKLG